MAADSLFIAFYAMYLVQSGREREEQDEEGAYQTTG